MDSCSNSRITYLAKTCKPFEAGLSKQSITQLRTYLCGIVNYTFSGYIICQLLDKCARRLREQDATKKTLLKEIKKSKLKLARSDIKIGSSTISICMVKNCRKTDVYNNFPYRSSYGLIQNSVIWHSLYGGTASYRIEKEKVVGYVVKYNASECVKVIRFKSMVCNFALRCPYIYCDVEEEYTRDCDSHKFD